MKLSLHTAGLGLTVVAMTPAVGVGVVPTASAAPAAAARNVVSEWFPTAYDCQYRGNVLAQRGVITGFSCQPDRGGWTLTGWHA